MSEPDAEKPFETPKTLNVRGRGWVLTIPAETFTREYVEKALEKYLYVGQLEQGLKTGYKHFQVYIESANPIKGETLQNKFSVVKDGVKRSPCHFEVRRGTIEQAYAYCTKEESRVGPTFSNASKEDFLKLGLGLREALELISKGELTPDEILLSAPRLAEKKQALDNMYSVFLSAQAKVNPFRAVDVEYWWGKTGVGKTKLVYETFPIEQIYRVSSYAHPWDFYRGERVLVLDEFRGQLSFSFLLSVLDVYPLQLPARYRNSWAAWEKVIIISNDALDDLYLGEITEASREALERRIKKVRFFS